MWLIRLILLPFVVVGAYLTTDVLGRCIAQHNGAMVNATILEKRNSRRHGLNHYYAICEYALNGRIFRNNEAMNASEFASSNPGDRLIVKAVSFGSFGFSVRTNVGWSQTLSSVGFVIVWDAILCVFVMLVFVLPLVVRLMPARTSRPRNDDIST